MLALDCCRATGLVGNIPDRPLHRDLLLHNVAAASGHRAAVIPLCTLARDVCVVCAGGSLYNPNFGTSAYMLVYIKESSLREVMFNGSLSDLVPGPPDEDSVRTVPEVEPLCNAIPPTGTANGGRL